MTQPGSELPGDSPRCTTESRNHQRGIDMRGVLLWAIGIPIPIIILLYLFNVL